MRVIVAFTIIAFGLSAADWDWKLPQGFPRPAVPADNPMSPSKVELGRHLFYDRRMSVNGKASCATCHKQELAFTDGRAHAEGATGQLHPRSSMSLINVAYAPKLTWAHPELESLEEQALVPMMGVEPIELGLKDHAPEFLAAVNRDPVYRKLFAEAFPSEKQMDKQMDLNHVTKALAAFERSIVSARSPYDRYRWGGEMAAISDAAKRGEIIFSSSERGGCFQCHGGWNFSSVRFEGNRVGAMGEGSFFNTGVTEYAAPNRGLFERTGHASDMGKFRAPTLRNIAITAPYMHDGSMSTLDEVVDHYARGGKVNHPNKTRVLRTFALSPSDTSDLIEFLTSLTDEEMRRDPRWSDPWPASSLR